MSLVVPFLALLLPAAAPQEADPAVPVPLRSFRPAPGVDYRCIESLFVGTNGEVRASINLFRGSEYEIRVHASGTSAKDDFARFKVLVDGLDTRESFVTTEKVEEHSLIVELAPGDHAISIVLVNDEDDPETRTSRDLAVTSVMLYDEDEKPTPVELWRFKPVGELAFSHTAYAVVATNGSIQAPFKVDAAGDYEIRVSAAGTAAKNEFAQYRLQVDGKDTDGTVTTKAEGELGAASFRLTPGEHALAIVFLNDAVDPESGADRDLYLYGVEIQKK